ncbi:MAG: hypothetical protein ABR927_12800 [Bacteroidales bacterium]|jgi:hypothetical protein
MKRIFFITLLLIGVITLNGQANKVDQLQALEQNQPADQNIATTATLKSASRLFATKDDLTSVIFIIPADSVVSVLDSDSTYFHVVFNENEGYIFKKDAILDKTPVNNQPSVQLQPAVQQNEPVNEQQQQDRYSYLENKYGSNMAPRLIAGKIWKGMNSEMVRDSWGTAEKINRIVSGNIVKEEWIFRNTWLYFENNTLLEWGPVKK